MQRIPWPSEVSKVSSTRPEAEEGPATKWIGHDTWLISEGDLPWLIDLKGIVDSCFNFPINAEIQDAATVIDIAHSRAIGAEVWITSDGRAYFAQMFHEEEEEPQGDGTLQGTATASAAPSKASSVRTLWVY